MMIERQDQGEARSDIMKKRRVSESDSWEKKTCNVLRQRLPDEDCYQIDIMIREL